MNSHNFICWIVVEEIKEWMCGTSLVVLFILQHHLEFDCNRFELVERIRLI